MSVTEDVVATLTGDAGLSALVGTRVYPVLAPQGTTRPFVTYQRIGADNRAVLGGEVSGDQEQIQLDAWADSYTQAHAVTAAVIAAMDGASTFSSARVTGPIDRDFERDTQLYGSMTGYSVWRN